MEPTLGQVVRSGDGSGQVTGPARGQVRQVVRSGRWSGQGRQVDRPSQGRQGQAGGQAHFRSPWALRYFSKILL